MFWYTASAVPRYHSSLMRCWGGTDAMYSPSSEFKIFHPLRMCLSSECDLY